MTSEGNGKLANINKPKALSALSVGGVSYPSVLHALGQLSTQDYWGWLSGHHRWIAAVVAGVMAAIAAYRTKDTAEEPTKWQQKKEAKLDQKVAASLNRLNGNGDH